VITKLEKPKKRPYWASRDVWERTESVVIVMLLGNHYHIPVTESTRPLLSLLDGALDPWQGFKGRRSDFGRRKLAEEGFMDIISAVYEQVEAYSVANASQLLAQEIKDKLEPLIQNKIHQNIQQTKAIGFQEKPKEG